MIEELVCKATQGLWYILPAYVANSSAVFARGKTPIDGNGNFFLDGKPLLGKGKTVEGFIFSVLVGTLIGAFQGYISQDFYSMTVLGFMLSVGTMVGDAAGSFLKRRFDLKRGEAAPLLDQWDFLVGAFVFGYLSYLFLGVGRNLALPELTVVLIILVITPILHVLTNWIAYKISLKKEPW